MKKIIHENVLYKLFTRNISGTVPDHVNFFSSFGTLSEKSSSWFPSFTVKYILEKSHNFNFSYLHMEPESNLIVKSNSSLANLNPLTNFEFTFLQIKLLGNEIQEKIYLNDILSIKSVFVAS